MGESLLLRIFFIFLGFLFIICSAGLQAVEIDLSPNQIESGEIVEAPKEMTQKQMNDLFGEDPYLGQTSYLQSPDSYREREESQ